MNTFESRIEAHPLFAHLGELETVLRSQEDVEVPPDVREGLERLRIVAAFCRASIAGTDAYLIPAPMLENADANLQNVLAQLNAFVQSPDVGYVVNANAHADALLMNLGQIPRAQPSEAVGEAQEAVSSLRKSASQHLRHLTTQVEALKSSASAIEGQLATHDAGIQQQQARLDGAIAEYQQQFSTAEAQRAQSFNQTVATAQTQLAAVTTDAQKSADADLAELRTKLDEALTAVTATSRGAQAKAEKDAQSALERLESLRQQAVRVVNVIGNTGLTGGYQKVANSECVAADRWRWIAVVSFAIAALGNGGVLVAELVYGLSLATLLAARLSVSIPLLALSAYAVAESRHHRKLEQGFRQMELQLASVDPFIVQFPRERQFDIKDRLIDRFFAPSQEGAVLMTPPPDDAA